MVSITEIYSYFAWATVLSGSVQIVCLLGRSRIAICDILAHFTIVNWLLVAIGAAIALALGINILGGILLLILVILTLYIPEYFQRVRYARVDDDQLDGDTTLTLMSYNIKYNNQRKAEVINYVIEILPDVVVLQEITGEWKFILDYLDGAYPHSLKRARQQSDDSYGIALYSRYPMRGDIREVEKVPYIDARIRKGDNSFRVLSTHFLNPIISTHWRRSKEQVRTIIDELDASEATIFCGDLNTTPNGHLYRTLIKSGKLLPTGIGRSLLPTWGIGVPYMLQLDHVFISDHLTLLGEFLGRANGSDHRPVITKVALKPTG